MHVVMDMLAGDGGFDALRHLGTAFDAGALELASLLFETKLDGGGISVVVLTLLDGKHLVVVLFGQDLPVLDGLNGSVVVVLVHLTVDGGLDVLMAVLGDFLLNDGRSDLLVDGGVMVTGLVPSIQSRQSACCLSFLSKITGLR